MSRTERALVTALRDELASIDPSRACDRAAEAAGLGGGRLEREPSVTRLAVRLRLGDGPLPDIDWDAARDHCRVAWLRGRFLARGSLSLAGGRTHLEFVVPPEQAAELAGRLDAVGLPVSARVRRGRGVVTSKSSEAVDAFLRRLGAGATLLEIEARAVSRALRGELNRVLNAESANLQRAVTAAGRQLDAIAVLDADGRLARQRPTVKAVAEARRSTPEASLSELAERLGAHRSAVQRALERLERLAADTDADTGDEARAAGGPRRRRGAARAPARPGHAALA